MIQKVSDSVYFILGKGFDSNSVLVVSDIVFLVDTGTGENIDYLKQQIASTGQEVDAVVNTHCHFDHIGGNQFFNVPVFIHKKDLPYLAAGDSNYTSAALFNESLPKTNPTPLPSEFHGWEVIHTPGHTEGSVCLYKNNVLISGDTLFAEGVGRTDLPGGDENKLSNSLNKLKQLNYQILLPGHGPLTTRRF